VLEIWPGWPAGGGGGQLSYPIVQAKSSTHCMYAQDQLFDIYGPKVFTDNQISRIKYIYYINNVFKD
jgi:hypothetical protein